MNYLKIFLLFTVCLTGCNSGSQSEKENEEEKSQEMKRSEEFVTIDPKEIYGNPIRMIGEEWMLITAGNQESYNTMTAGWGTLGLIWGKPVATCYIHPDRYTFEFMEKNEYYTLCFFDEEYKAALTYCGTESGRDHKEKNKAEAAGLTPLYTENGNVYFKEAYLVLECRKLYSAPFKSENFATNIVTLRRDGTESVYNEMPQFHKFYIGEIVKSQVRHLVGADMVSLKSN
ncbi:MAG: flavin reductase [Bacteroidales bacterium]|jgi:flavin reductase (DIM6/NTAB) family NADH-FMN oxidoreductase RutF|nr:flavin reductase [Bacteroidales bacterium]